MLASTFRDALLGGVGGLAAVMGTVIVVVALLASDRRKARGPQHPSNPKWDPEQRDLMEQRSKDFMP